MERAGAGFKGETVEDSPPKLLHAEPEEAPGSPQKLPLVFHPPFRVYLWFKSEIFSDISSDLS